MITLNEVKKLVSIHAYDDWMMLYDVKKGHLKIAKYLISKGIDIHINNDWALRWAAYNGHLDVVKYLVSQGADVHACNNYALRYAAQNGHLKIYDFLKNYSLERSKPPKSIWGRFVSLINRCIGNKNECT
jgi:hypothetical protein